MQPGEYFSMLLRLALVSVFISNYFARIVVVIHLKAIIQFASVH